MRIAITMRVVETQEYDEPRDALAQDWADFMAVALPGVAWMPFPNIGENAIALAESWGIEGVILSGGNDLSEKPLRDATERALLQWAIANDKPVFGVCRGLQLIQNYFGGSLEPCKGHAATRHSVIMGDSGMNVNSYHNWCIPQAAPGLEVIAKDADGNIEAVAHESHAIAGVMWHPEREPQCKEIDTLLMQQLFMGDAS